MKVKQIVDEMQNPNIELVNVQKILQCDKVTIITTNGGEYSFSKDELIAVNDKVIVYQKVNEAIGMVQHRHIAIDKVVGIIYVGL